MSNLIDLDNIIIARRHAAESACDFMSALMAQIGEEDFWHRVADTVGMPLLSALDLKEMQPAFEVIAFTETSQRRCIPVRNADEGLLLVLDDPFNTETHDWLEGRLAGVARALLPTAELTSYLAECEASQRAIDAVLLDADSVFSPGIMTSEVISLSSIAEGTSQVVNLVNSTLYDALQSRASDIHLETTVAGLTIKYRIDGVLRHVGDVQGLERAEQILSRLKVMSELDISERRIPQDGRFKVAVSRREVDFRVSIMPSVHGEDAVLRVLDRQAHAEESRGLRLGMLGLEDSVVAIVRKLAAEPHGMLLVTGPTGSGKTTTLYAAICEVDHLQDKVITIEDPVEYQLPGILQIPVNEKKGLTFARGLRSILRHDPDKIMVGEIRDQETATIAIQAALTGHLVYTTVHANSVFDVVSRFAHMGVDQFSFTTALNGILAQRLLRLICPNCAVDYVPDDQLLADSGLQRQDVLDFQFRIGRGCLACNATGYKGRKAIAEVLKMTDQLRERMMDKVPISQLKLYARQDGTRFLREVALDIVKNGGTTLQEINRVTFVE